MDLSGHRLSSAAQNQAVTGLVIIRGKKEVGGETKTEHGGGGGGGVGKLGESLADPGLANGSLGLGSHSAPSLRTQAPRLWVEVRSFPS